MFCVSSCSSIPLLPWIPPVPIKLNCTKTMLCCGGVGSELRCGCSSPEIQSLYSSPPHPPCTHTHTHTLPMSSSQWSLQLVHISTPLTRLVNCRQTSWLDRDRMQFTICARICVTDFDRSCNCLTNTVFLSRIPIWIFYVHFCQQFSGTY